MSCLFNSLSYFINLSSLQIRQMICDYLQEDKPIIEGLTTKEVLLLENSDYISHMRDANTWGGAIEIQCACNIWSMKINVYNHRDNARKIIDFLPMNGNFSSVINIYWTGSHYEPIR